jgi:putative ABC transport system permease protein|nr:ABC transporter permease [Candidatus Acidoferrales bacterium]
MHKMIATIRNFFHREKIDRDLDAEIRSYSDLLQEEKMSNGMSANEAKREARISMIGPEQLKEEIRSVRSGAWLESLWQDLKFGARMLRKNPGFTAIAVLTLALGIGANTAIFSVIESQLWRPLPFPDSERVYQLDTTPPENATSWYGVSGSQLLAWRAEAHAFDAIAGFGYPWGRNFSAGTSTGRVRAMQISSGFFETLQTRPVLGRTFTLADEAADNSSSILSTLIVAPPQRIVILSHDFWRDNFGSDPSAIGKTVTLDGIAHTIIGVAPPSFHLEFAPDPDLYVPLRVGTEATSRYSNDTFSVIAHLAPDSTPERARAEMNAIILRQMADEGSHAPRRVLIFGKLRVIQTSYAGSSLFFFAGATALVLLIACVNIAGLLLARSLTRQREFALRTVLGASRGTIIRQLLVESLLISLMGGAAGILVSLWGARGFAALLHVDSLPRTSPIELDTHVLLFTLSFCVLAAVIVGLLPALFASRADVNDALRQGSRGVTHSRSQKQSRVVLLVAEVSLALLLLFGAGLFLGSFIKLQEAPLGFDPHGILTARIMLRGTAYATPAAQRNFYDRVTSSVGAIPGIRSVAVSSSVPLQGGGRKSFTIPGRPIPTADEEPNASVFSVPPNFLDVYRIHLLAGRNFTERDSSNTSRVAIVNQNFARHFFPNEDPVGKVLNFTSGGYGQIIPPGQVQIVGMIQNVQEWGANEIPVDDLYLPFAQSPAGKAMLSITSGVSPATLLPSIRQALQGIDKDQPVYGEQTMEDSVLDSVKGARSNLMLVTLLAIVATVLVSIGIYGTISHFVQQRTQEFGIRLALGASPARILRHTLAQTMKICVSGLVVGIAVSLTLAKLLRPALYLAPHEHVGMLYGVSIYDPISLSAASALIAVVVILASYIPARRAMRVDPMVALRHE